MIAAGKNGRSVLAMTLNEPHGDVIGIVQCNLAGCEAHRVLLASDGAAGPQIQDFLETHECDINRYIREKYPHGRFRPGQRLWVPGARSSWGKLG